jgi:putative sigma-54 modulation protein
MHMNTNIKATNMELTSAIKDYVNKKVESLEKFLGATDSEVYVEVGKTTQHHKNGEYYKAEFSLASGDIKLFAMAEESDLYAAIDSVREEIVRSIKEVKNRKQTLFTRGARSVKKMLKGLSSRNPNTSKYE